MLVALVFVRCRRTHEHRLHNLSPEQLEEVMSMQGQRADAIEKLHAAAAACARLAREAPSRYPGAQLVAEAQWIVAAELEADVAADAAAAVPKLVERWMDEARAEHRSDDCDG